MATALAKKRIRIPLRGFIITEIPPAKFGIPNQYNVSESGSLRLR